MITVVYNIHYKALNADAINDVLEDTVVLLHFSYTWRPPITVT